jgi:hypothetical protein
MTRLAVAASGRILPRPVVILMHLSRIPLILFLAFLACPRCFAQSWLYPESIQPMTLLASGTAEDAIAFLPRIAFWGEAGLYVFDTDRDHRWDVTIGGTSQLLRGRDWELIHETSVHLAVDPNNNIAFNPRAFMWETGLLFGYRTDAAVWQFGYQHRCKHDVDNVELLATTGVEEQRALIYGSAVARWRHHAISIEDWTLDPLLEAHVYLPRQDQRFPEWTRSIHPLVTAFLGAVRTRQSISRAIGEHVSAGLLADLRLTLIGSGSGRRFSSVEALRFEPAVEAFLDLRGGDTMRLFLRYVHEPDDFIPPVPRATHLVAVGIRLFPGH